MRGLGELEATVMTVLWAAEEPLKVRDVLERLDTGRQTGLYHRDEETDLLRTALRRKRVRRT